VICYLFVGSCWFFLLLAVYFYFFWCTKHLVDYYKQHNYVINKNSMG
jgi:hypothetical protein